MGIASGKHCIGCKKYHHSVNGAIPLTLPNGCDVMVCLDCLIDRVKDRIAFDNEHKTTNTSKKTAKVDRKCPFIQEECEMIYRRVSCEPYLYSKHNQALRDSILDKVSKMLNEYKANDK